jgi:hypothetical protein
MGPVTIRPKLSGSGSLVKRWNAGGRSAGSHGSARASGGPGPALDSGGAALIFRTVLALSAREC